MPTIVFTVTNELSYDQRMQRICHSLAKNGYSVLLIGRNKPGSIPLKEASFKQKRLPCLFHKGPLFYLEYNIRLFIFLLFTKADGYCAIDLDTILPVYFASKIKGRKRVYDAHEYFTEQKEVLRRPFIQRIWLAIESFALPRFPLGYTVNNWIAQAFESKYGVQYAVLRNLPSINNAATESADQQVQPFHNSNRFLIYQGAVNEGRCFETLIPAMGLVDCKLKIYGTGNFINQSLSIINDKLLINKVSIISPVIPAQLRLITPTAFAGITLFELAGANQYHSLANRFFDYIMAGIPQLCVDYPEYRAINQQFEVALLIKDTSIESIAAGLNKLLNDPVLYQQLKLNCLEARKILNWEREELELLAFYQRIQP